MKLLIIEDDKALNDGIALSFSGSEILQAYSLEEARRFIDLKPDLAILDISLPDGSGLDFCREIRGFCQTPVIFLTANDMEIDIVAGLESGADDYITKPFGTGELMARIRTSLRHSHAQTPGHVYKALDLEIDFEKRLIRLRGEEVHLTQIEYQLLTLLAENSGRVLTYSYIMNAIWGPYMDNNNQILRVNMANIRRKLEQNPAQPQYVFTEIGVGYRMRENENGGTV
mgnify:CR=1 FL=1